MYIGRFMFASGVQMNTSPWRNSQLFVDGRTSPIDQLATLDMDTVEDLDPEALPTTHDDSAANTIQGAQRFQQIGVEAGKEILKKALENVAFSDRVALVVVDAAPDVGPIYEAWLHTKLSQSTPLCYFGTPSTAVHKDWLTQTWVDRWARQVSEGKLNIPGHSPKTAEPPTDLLEQMPPRPSLNKLVWMRDAQGQEGRPAGLKMPKPLMDIWYQHPGYGQRFRDFYDKLVNKCGVEEPHKIMKVHID